jgi:signal transduction histidine kinase/CheY-like chemotaxis protein
MPSKYQQITGFFLVKVALCLLIAASANAWQYEPEYGFPLTKDYWTNDHGGGKINYGIAHDRWDNRFFANQAGVLKFDGAHWMLLPATGQPGFTICLTVDQKNQVWAIQSNTVGYYSITPTGGYAYIDMSETVKALPGSDTFGEYRRLLCDDAYVYLITASKVLQWDGTSWISHAFESEAPIFPSILNGSLYIHSIGEGLYRRVGTRFVKISKDSEATTSGIIRILSDTEKGLLCATVSNGLVYYKEGTFSRFPTQIDSLLENATIKSAAIHSEDTIALGTQSNGLFILDQTGRIIVHIKQSNASISALDFDSTGGIWLAQTDRITHIPNLPISLYLTRKVDHIARHKNKLYLATINTLEALEWENSSGPNLEIKNLKRNHKPTSMISIGDEMIFGGLNSFNILKADGTIDQISHDLQVINFHQSRKDPSILYMTDNRKVNRIQKVDDQWRMLDALPEPYGYYLTLNELADGSVLATSTSNPVRQIIWPEDESEEIQIRTWTEEYGLPDEFLWSYFLQSGDTRILITNQGLYRYDPDERYFEFDPVLGEDLGTDRGALEYSHLAEGDGWAIWLHKVGAAQNIGFAGILRIRNDRLTWEQLQLPLIHNLGRIESILHEKKEDREFLWLGGKQALYRYDLDKIDNPSNWSVRFTSVKDADTDNVFYAGAGAIPDKNEWNYNDKSIHFEFAVSPCAFGYIRYQSRLVGFDTDWSLESPNNFRKYTNLREGNYRLEIRALDEFNRSSKVSSFTFTILPPWHRTVYAYFVYIGVTATICVLLLRWQLSRLRKRNLELTEAHRIKQDFLASMSHEIRNPLNGILGIASMMHEDELESGKPSERINHLYSCASHLHQLLGQALDYSSLESGKLEVHPVSFDPLSLVADVVAMHRSFTRDKKLKLELDLPEIDKQWVGDPVLLRQILINLVSNAIKFTEFGTVWIRLSYLIEGDSVAAKFEVEDTGSGIPSDRHEYIFEEFTRIPQSGENQPSGTGLGLAIASRLTNTIGGTLELDPSYTHGARFTLKIRAQLGNHIQKHEAAPKNRCDLPLKNKKVLLADDMDFNRFSSKELLERFGAKVELAVNGLEALEQLQQTDFDLAILDIHMPKLSGNEVVKDYLSKNPKQPPLLIALSAYVSSEMSANCLENGFDNFIEKPLEPNKLKTVLIERNFNTASQSTDSTSLLDYLANNDPKAAQALQQRYQKSILDELGQLRYAIQSHSKVTIKNSIHKLKGLSSMQRDERINELLDQLSEIQANHSMTELIELCDQIEAQLNQQSGEPKHSNA